MATGRRKRQRLQRLFASAGLIVALAIGLCGAPPHVEAQPGGTVRIGYLSSGSAVFPLRQVFEDALRAT